MVDYISREAAVEWFVPFAHMGEDSIPTDTVIQDLKYAIPAADVEPVQYAVIQQTTVADYYGTWGVCPECGYKDNTVLAKYCGGCGAILIWRTNNDD